MTAPEMGERFTIAAVGLTAFDTDGRILAAGLDLMAGASA